MLLVVREIHNTFEIVLSGDIARMRCTDCNPEPPPRPLFKIHCSYVFYDDKSVA
jgi:hypothetical protein